MTPSEEASLICCTWDRLLGFVRRRFPKLGKYGSTAEAQAPALVKLMQNPVEMARIADALFKIDCAYSAATESLRHKYQKAEKDRSDAELALLATISLDAPFPAFLQGRSVVGFGGSEA